VTASVAIGFQSVTDEYNDHRPPVEGTVPSWLSGTLIRNGPGRFAVGGRRVSHWFDGLAMLRRYAFDEGEVRYSNRFLRTEAFADAQSGTLTGQFATDTRGWRRILDSLRSLGLPEPTDNTNVHVAKLDDTFVALTEAPRRVAFDPVTLETTGEFRFDDDLPEQLTAAHLVADPHRTETVGFTTEFGIRPQYHVYRVPDGSRQRECLASIPARGPAYIHDCSVTADHVLLVESPLTLSVWRALNPFSQGAIDLLDWNPDQQTRLLVIDRDTGDLVADPTFEATFCFHHINAFVDGDEIVLDLIEFPDGEIVDSLSLSALEAGGFSTVPPGRLMRYRIDPTANRVDRTQLFAGGMELPRVVSEKTGRRHRYAYGQATDRDGANGLAKVDCEAGTSLEWFEQSVYVEEPIPIQRPGASAEDDGVVLATAIDVEQARSLLLVFDAETLSLLARVVLPHTEPFGFHGRFFESIPQ